MNACLNLVVMEPHVTTWWADMSANVPQASLVITASKVGLDLVLKDNGTKAAQNLFVGYFLCYYLYYYMNRNVEANNI